MAALLTVKHLHVCLVAVYSYYTYNNNNHCNLYELHDVTMLILLTASG